MDTILFEPGMGISQYSLRCSDVSELKAKVFRRKRKNESAVSKITEPKYCPGVLQGNWFEERVECSPVSEHLDPPCEGVATSSAKNDMKENLKIAKMIKDKGRGTTREFLVDHDSAGFQSNFSTVYDLTYRYLPQISDKPRLRSYNARINKWVPEQDLTKNFGNVTGYGMTEYVKALEDELVYEENEKPRSHYQCDYVKKEMPTDIKRFHRKRVDPNIPDLGHLNIDLNTCWSHYLGQGFQKKDFSQRIISGRY